jgi:hypothetical protein
MNSTFTAEPALLFLLGPWLLLGLVLSGPFLALLVVVAIALAAAAIPVGAVLLYMAVRDRFAA